MKALVPFGKQALFSPKRNVSPLRYRRRANLYLFQVAIQIYGDAGQ